jgi:hypothetical protein
LVLQNKEIFAALFMMNALDRARDLESSGFEVDDTPRSYKRQSGVKT